MGLFDKIKQVGSFFGDGGATVQVRPAQQVSSKQGSVGLIINVSVKDKELDVRKVYLKIKAEEKASIPDVRQARKVGEEVRTSSSTVNKTHQTYQTEIQLKDPIQLDANQAYEWEAEFQVPHHVNPTYRGHFVQHEWSVYVGLDVAGNDPDSNWVPIEISG